MSNIGFSYSSRGILLNTVLRVSYLYECMVTFNIVLAVQGTAVLCLGVVSKWSEKIYSSELKRREREKEKESKKKKKEPFG